MFTNKPINKPDASLEDLKTYLDKLLLEEQKKSEERHKAIEKFIEKNDPALYQEHKNQIEKLKQEKDAYLARLHSANPIQLLELKEELDKQLQEERQIYLQRLKTIKELCKKISASMPDETKKLQRS